MGRPKELRIRKDGEQDNRGEAEGAKATQFKSGDGRRRPGRPKGSKDERTETREIQNMLVEVEIKGRKKMRSTRFAMMLVQRGKALKGDRHATEWLDQKFSKHEPPIYEPDLTQKLLAEDEVLLAHAYARGLLPPDIAPPASEPLSPEEGEEEEQS